MDQTEADTQRSSIFAKRTLGRIFALDKNGLWWKIRNNELYYLYKAPDTIRSIRISKLRCKGHVNRIEENEIPKRASECKVDGRIKEFGDPSSGARIVYGGTFKSLE